MKMHISILAILALFITTISCQESCPDDCTSPEHGTCNTETGECECNHGYSHSDYTDNCAECDTKCNDGMCMVTKWCDTEKDCPDGEDEEECCTNNPESSNDKIECENEDNFFCECTGECIDKSKWCDGKNDCCTTYHGIGSTNVTCADWKRGGDFVAPDEENCQCPNDQFKCIQKGKPTPNDCITKDKKCDGNNDCQDGSDESGCPTQTPIPDPVPIATSCDGEDQFTCIHADGQTLPLECIEKDKQCDGNKDCQDGSDELDCPSDTPLWLILLIILIVLLVIAILGWAFWYFYIKKKREGSYDPQNPEAREKVILIPSNEKSQPDLPQSNGNISPEHDIPIIKTLGSPSEGRVPSRVGGDSQLSPDEPEQRKFSYEDAAQSILKTNRKNTTNIKIDPNKGMLMSNFPKDRIDEERSVSPQPPQAAQQPTSQIGLNYPMRNLDRQVSETVDNVIRYAGATGMPVSTTGKKRQAGTKINYALEH